MKADDATPPAKEQSTLPFVVSDADGTKSTPDADFSTGLADIKLPTFESPNSPPFVNDAATSLRTIQAGHRLGDYELVRELGAGSFGRVFLARQLSLDRMVALKATAESSGEALALATLEHDYIVRVFGKDVDFQTGLHLLAMQYVPGTTLGRVLETFDRRPGRAWTGSDFLDEVVANDNGLVQLDPTTLRDRNRLEHFDHIETVCWVGARLAEALAHAHRHGILHRDIKPSNILLSTNGRVLLTDFNLATDPRHEGQTFGGTLSYMAPEHLDAFNPGAATPPEQVDARSDIYSLGVVLFEMLTGRRPFAAPGEGLGAVAALRAMADERRQESPSPRRLRPEIPLVLDRVIRRCLQADPKDRYSTAGELAQVLDGCRELYGLNRAAPAGRLTHLARKNPVLMASVLPLLPHLFGAIVVFGYTAVWVASHPAKSAVQGVFVQLSIWYSAIVFPVTGIIAYYLTRPIWRTCAKLNTETVVDSAETARIRQRALRKPIWGAMLSGLGWLPGAVLLPALMVAIVPEAASWDILIQYFLSFVIAGLIALTYTEFADQFLLLCLAYPSLWVDPVHPQQTAHKELGPVERRLRIFQILAALVPLTTALALMVRLITASPEQRASSAYQAYLIVVTGLMLLGMAGAWLAVVISGRLGRVAAALAGAQVELGHRQG